jgi:hypothetical protein
MKRRALIRVNGQSKHSHLVDILATDGCGNTKSRPATEFEPFTGAHRLRAAVRPSEVPARQQSFALSSSVVTQRERDFRGKPAAFGCHVWRPVPAGAILRRCRSYCCPRRYSRLPSDAKRRLVPRLVWAGLPAAPMSEREVNEALKAQLVGVANFLDTDHVELRR